MIAAYFAPPRVDVVIVLALLMCGTGWAYGAAALIVAHAALRPTPDHRTRRPGPDAPTA